MIFIEYILGSTGTALNIMDIWTSRYSHLIILEIKRITFVQEINLTIYITN